MPDPAARDRISGLASGLHDREAAVRPPAAVGAVSVVICTYARCELVVAAVRSVLDCTGVTIDLIVVDQSPDDRTHEALHALPDSRLRYVRTDTIGLSAARNVGIRMARHPVVLLTDDDVTVPPGWCSAFLAAIPPTERVAVAFCTVDAGPHDSEHGFVPEHQVARSLVVRSLSSKSRIRGIGAGMAVRRDAVMSFGGFDEQLGAGAPLRSGEDRDLAARALASGWWICQTPDAYVVHHGFRTWYEGRELTRRDWYGIGAAYAKQVKLLNPRIIPVIAHEAVYYGLLKPIAVAVVGHRLEGLRRLPFFVAGFTRGLRMPVDRRTMLYRPRSRNA